MVWFCAPKIALCSVIDIFAKNFHILVIFQIRYKIERDLCIVKGQQTIKFNQINIEDYEKDDDAFGRIVRIEYNGSTCR